MKHISYVFIGMALVLAGCSKDDNKPIEPLKEKTYTGSDLALYYNGNTMPSKSVTLTQNGDKGTAKLFSEFDLSQLSAFGLSGKIPAPGVFPGSPETVLDLDMISSGGNWKFSGKGETTYCTYSYEGSANGDKLTLSLNNVKLKTGGITPAVWQPAPIKKEDGAYTSLPVYLDWQYDPIPDVDINFSPILDLLATVPVIPVYNNTAYMSVSEALSLMVKTIAFNADGNIIVSYISNVGGASRLAQTYPNSFMYLPVSQSDVKLFLDPTSVFGMVLMSTSTGTPADEVKIIGNGMYPSGVTSSPNPGPLAGILSSELGQKVSKALLSALLPQLAEGLPMAFSIKDGTLNLFLDTPMVAAIIQEVVVPLLKDEASIKAIGEYLASVPELAPLLPDIQKALQVLPQALERTTTFRIGLSLIPYTGK